MAKIIIKRKSKMAGSAQKHDVFLYNDFVGVLKNGGSLEIPVGIGCHNLIFKSKLKKMGKDTSFTAIINDENEIVPVNAGFNLSGDFIVEYADNKPHLPVVKDASSNGENSVNNYSGVRCGNCGSSDLMPVSEVTTKGKDFKADDACCGYLLCGPLGLLCGATGKGKQTKSTTYWMCKNCGNKFKA